MPPGRNTKLTDEVKKIIVDAILEGGYVNEVCKLARISETTYYDWISRGKLGEEPFLEFLESVEEAEAISLQEHVRTHRKLAIENEDVKAIEWFLQHRSKNWAGQTVVEVNVKKMPTKEELDAELEHYRRAIAESVAAEESSGTRD